MPKAGNAIALTLSSHPPKDPNCDFLKDATPYGKSQLMFCSEASSLRMVPVRGLKYAKTLSNQQALRTFKHLALTTLSPLLFP